MERRTLLTQKAFWSFLFLCISWVFYFWSTLKTIFAGSQESWIIFSSWAISVSAIFLVFVKRKALENSLIVSSQLGLFFLALTSLGYILGGVFSAQYVQQCAVMLMIPGFVITIFGPAVSRIILFPLAYLMLVLPLQNNTIGGLQLTIVITAPVLFVFYFQFQQYRKQEPVVELGGKPKSYYQNSRWLAPTAIVYSLLMLSPWLTENIRSFYPKKERQIVLRTPIGVHGWTGPIAAVSDNWKAIYPNASSTIQVRYSSADITDENGVYLYTAYYYSDRTASEMLDPNNTLYDPKLWKQVGFQTIEKPFPDKRANAVLEIILEGETASRVVWYWYYVAGVSTADPSIVRSIDKVRVVSKYAQGSGVVLISSAFEQSPNEARDRLQSFMTAMYDSLAVLKRPKIIYAQDNQDGK